MVATTLLCLVIAIFAIIGAVIVGWPIILIALGAVAGFKLAKRLFGW